MAKIDLPQSRNSIFISTANGWRDRKVLLRLRSSATGGDISHCSKGVEKETKEAIQAANKAFEGWSQTLLQNEQN